MSFSGLLVHDVTIVSPGSMESRYHDDLKDWDTASRVTVKGWLSQRSEIEALGSRETGISEWVLFLPAGADITGADRVEWADHVFEVTGEPNRAWSPRGEHHVEVPLRALSDQLAMDS